MQNNFGVIDLFPEPTFLVRKESYNIEFVNKKTLHLFNIKKESIVNRKLFEFIEKDFLKEGTIDKCIVKLSDQFVVKCKLVVESYDENSLIVFIVSESADIDVFEKRRNSFKECNDERFKTMIDSSEESICVLQNGVLKYANVNFLLMLGYRLSDLQDRDFKELIPAAEFEKLNCISSIYDENERNSFKCDSALILRDGTILPVNFNFKYGDCNGVDLCRIIVEDISDKKISEIENSDYMNSAPIGFYQTTPSGIIKKINNTFVKVLGYSSKAELINRNVSEIVLHNSGSDLFVNNFSQRPKLDFQIYLKKKDGFPISLYISQKAIKNTKQEVICYKGYVIDIKRVNEELENNNLYYDVLSSSLNAIGIASLEGDLFYVNNSALNMWGYSRDEVIGSSLLNLWEGNCILSTLKQLEENGVSSGEDVGRRKDGSLFYVQYFAKVIKDSNGKPLYIWGSFIDITKRKEHEIEISRLYQAINQSPSAVVLVNVEGVILYTNKKLCQMSGYSEDELVGVNIDMFRSGLHSDDFYTQLYETLSSGRVWKGEFFNKKKNGDIYIEEAMISPVLNDDGVVVNYIKTARDITREREIKDELVKAKKKAEESDRLKSAFLANISHEIRTPMNGILGFTNLLLDRELSESDREEFLNLVLQSGERMLKTVTEIVEISMIETGEVKIRNSIIDLNECICGIIKSCKKKIECEHLELFFDQSKQESKTTIYTDKSKFESILINLIDNAIKYTSDGQIGVSFSKIDGFTQFCVRDTGIGIPDNRMKAIFNRFEQADISTTRGFDGVGLGLSITKCYVDIMGGEIWVESESGVGSRFYFTIPDNEL